MYYIGVILLGILCQSLCKDVPIWKFLLVFTVGYVLAWTAL